MLVGYLVVWGPIGDGPEQYEALSTGAGGRCSASARPSASSPSAWCSCPTCAASGFTYRPRFDFRDPELRHTLSLGIWTVLFVIVTQAAYLVVVRLASGGTAAAGDGTGITVYSSSLLIMMVPHSIVTVSLATAILPRLSAYAHEDRLAELGSTVGSTLRTALALVLPFAVAAARRRGRRRVGGLRVGRPRARRRGSPRRWRSSAPRWSSSPSTTSCSAASTPWR